MLFERAGRDQAGGAIAPAVGSAAVIIRMVDQLIAVQRRTAAGAMGQAGEQPGRGNPARVLVDAAAAFGLGQGRVVGVELATTGAPSQEQLGAFPIINCLLTSIINSYRILSSVMTKVKKWQNSVR